MAAISKVKQGTAAPVAGAWPVEVTDGANVLGTPANPLRIDPTGATPQPVSAAALPLPAGAATEVTLATLATQVTAAAILAKLSADPATQTTLAAVLAKLSSDPATQTTLATLLKEATFTTRFPVQGQAAMAASVPVAIANNQSPVPVSGVTGISDGVWNDPFGRQRVSQNNVLFSTSFRFDLLPNLYQQSLTGGGTITSVPNEAAARLAVTAAAGDVARMQSYKYHVYRPGQGQVVILTGILGSTPAAGATKRLGLFDTDNGLFFGQDSGGVFVCRRTYVGGAPSDTAKYYQSAWNYDKLDGLGPSGFTVNDWTKAQIFVIDFQWLGMGRVRYALDINGVLVPVHVMNHANNLSTVYMTTACLPVRAEVVTTGPAASMDFVCASVVREGGAEEPTYESAVTTQGVGASGQSVGTNMTTMLSLRLTSTYKRAILNPTYCDVFNTGNTNPLYWELVRYRGSTLLAGWASAGTACEYSTNAITTAPATGGVVIHAGIVPSSTSQSKSSALKTFRETLLSAVADLAGTTDILCIRAKTLSSTTTAHFTLGFAEQY